MVPGRLTAEVLEGDGQARPRRVERGEGLELARGTERVSEQTGRGTGGVEQAPCRVEYDLPGGGRQELAVARLEGAVTLHHERAELLAGASVGRDRDVQGNEGGLCVGCRHECLADARS